MRKHGDKERDNRRMGFLGLKPRSEIAQSEEPFCLSRRRWTPGDMQVVFWLATPRALIIRGQFPPLSKFSHTAHSNRVLRDLFA